jgi:imidazoleglycerol phosphate dehydratase HisB
MANTPEENARKVMEQVMATPEGRAIATRLADKDEELSAFQPAHGISERIAEAAFKAVARALREAVEPDPRMSGVLPSTKGAL